jgi:hypothetical protein
VEALSANYPKQALLPASGSSFKILKDEHGFRVRGIHFCSYQEVQCFIYLRFLGLKDAEIGYEYPVGRRRIDFFPRGKVFWEHHPCHLGRSEDLFQYGKRRRLMLNQEGYDDVPLVVSDVIFNDPWEVSNYMLDHGVDFLNGRVPEGRSLLYVRGYEDNTMLNGEQLELTFKPRA